VSKEEVKEKDNEIVSTIFIPLFFDISTIIIGLLFIALYVTK